MKFAVINPKERTFKYADWIDFAAAKREAGLGHVDHGVCAHGIGIVVSEFGLYEPTDKQSYFAIGAQLYAGNAVMYAFDAHGKSIDLITYPPPRWFSSADAVEDAIQRRTVARPEVSMNGKVLWRWPEPHIAGG